MTGENLEEKLKTKEVLTKDIVKNFGLIAAIASDPNEEMEIGDDKIGVYGKRALDIVLKNVSDEAKEYLAPVFQSMATDHNQNGEFSPQSKNIFKFYRELYNQKIAKARAIDVVKLAEEYGFKKEDITKQLHGNYSIKELWDKYSKYIDKDDDKFEPKTAQEFEAHAVMKSIEYLNEYIKANAKGKIWDETVTDHLKAYKDRAENPGKHVKALVEARKQKIIEYQNRIKELKEEQEE